MKPIVRPRALLRLVPAAALGAALGAAAVAPALGGAIRWTKQMGPRARRMLRQIREERTSRDAARELRQRMRRAAVARVRVRGDDPDQATRVARSIEGQLRDRGFGVRPFRVVWPRVEALGEEVLESPHALRQLCRKFGVGRLLLVDVEEMRLADGHTAGFAVPSWWGTHELDQEFAEVQLRLRVYDEAANQVTVDRRDRQHRGVGSGHPTGELRDVALGKALGTCITHVLFDLAPGPEPDPGPQDVERPPAARLGGPRTSWRAVDAGGSSEASEGPGS